nr:MAG TPA: hypothetical protein [Caudoviricetes sp.]
MIYECFTTEKCGHVGVSAVKQEILEGSTLVIDKLLHFGL